MSTRRDFLQLSGGMFAIGTTAYFLGHRSTLEGLQSLPTGMGSHTDFGSWNLADRDGNTVHLSAQIRPATGVILYFIRANCEWCSRNRVAVNAIAEQLRTRYSAIGVLTEGDWPGTETYLFPVFRLQDSSSRLAIVQATPTTKFFTAEGSLEMAVEGAYVGANKRSLETQLGVILPDVWDFKL